MNAFNESAVKRYFQDLETVIEKYNFPVTNIYSADVKRVFVPSKISGRILGPK
jgi:hypothetical protein